ncbi:hypothetical protein AKO1_004239 [Acrasis kona]|uniref:Uncharacterized protein n=1 Tax=Acrasis kona TaxID=1008807 RepID=A0AAW2Z7P1_9EUKA
MAPTVYEEIGKKHGEWRVPQAQAPMVVREQGATHTVQQGEQVAEIVRQEIIERHIQPVITEVREQNIIQQIEQPIVRKIYDQTIFREVAPSATGYQSTNLLTSSTTTGYQTGYTRPVVNMQGSRQSFVQNNQYVPVGVQAIGVPVAQQNVTSFGGSIRQSQGYLPAPIQSVGVAQKLVTTDLPEQTLPVLQQPVQAVQQQVIQTQPIIGSTSSFTSSGASFVQQSSPGVNGLYYQQPSYTSMSQPSPLIQRHSALINPNITVQQQQRMSGGFQPTTFNQL